MLTGRYDGFSVTNSCSHERGLLVALPIPIMLGRAHTARQKELPSKYLYDDVVAAPFELIKGLFGGGHLSPGTDSFKARIAPQAAVSPCSLNI